MDLSIQELLERSNLSPLRVRSFLRNTSLTDAALHLPPSNINWILLSTFMLLDKLKFLTPDQRELIFSEMCNTPAKDRIHLLVIGDGRWATWSGFTGWLSLEDGTVANEEKKFIETMTYNLCVLNEKDRAILT